VKKQRFTSTRLRSGMMQNSEKRAQGGRESFTF